MSISQLVGFLGGLSEITVSGVLVVRQVPENAQTSIEKLKALIHESNVRRIVVEHQGRTVPEFPLTARVVAAVLAPPLAAIGALVVLLKDCTIQIERVEQDGKARRPKAAGE